MRDRLEVLSALADPHRLAMVDALADGDLAPGELGAAVGLASHHLAHHLRILEAAGVVARHRSEGDGRRAYVTLRHGSLVDAAVRRDDALVARVVFVGTTGAARSQFAAALLARRRLVPVLAAGTEPAHRLHPLAVAELDRRGMVPAQPRPAPLPASPDLGELRIVLCDHAYEAGVAGLHWSVPDPAVVGTSQAFREACDAIASRVARLAGRLVPATEPQGEPA